jgi:LysR family nitrogen assimilation transcriptional regulator
MTGMDLTRLQYFVAVAEAGSFSRAAAALHLTQPSLSRQVQLLEDELGQRLLERTGRGAVTTEAGTALLAHARSIFELAERARVDMQERQRNPRGRITVGLPPRVAHVITADLVERFHAAYPEAAITVVEGLSIRLREWLVAGRVDVAIVFDPPATPQIQVETLLREPLVLISTQPLPARLKLADVALRRLVMPSGPHALRQLLEEHTRPRGLPLQAGGRGRLGADGAVAGRSRRGRHRAARQRYARPGSIHNPCRWPRSTPPPCATAWPWPCRPRDRPPP